MVKVIPFVLFVLLQLSFFTAMANDLAKGREIFIQKCMGCHGEAGQGKLPGQPNFNEGEAFFKSESVLIDIVRDGKGVMPSFNGLLSEEDIRNVVAYVKNSL